MFLIFSLVISPETERAVIKTCYQKVKGQTKLQRCLVKGKITSSQISQRHLANNHKTVLT